MLYLMKLIPGVSGRVAQAIAEKIFEISCQSQVLCITHLPQVAAMADTHLYIEKKEKQNRTVTSVKELNKEEQIMELSRMLTGTQLTETAKDHAKELLDFASSYKEKEHPAKVSGVFCDVAVKKYRRVGKDITSFLNIPQFKTASSRSN